MPHNRQVLLARRPNGAPVAEDFELAQTDLPEPASGQMLLRTVYLSLDPYMRGRMNAEKSYADPVPVGGVMEGGTVSVVEKSNGGKFAEGDIVVGRAGWQDYMVSDGVSLSKVDPAAAPISTALGVLGMPGMTAYSGLLRLGKPKEGETLVVAAASGAVGANVGQIAKIKNCRVVGVCGSDDKGLTLTNDLGFDAAVNYKDGGYRDSLKAATPDGVDVYFDNTGGMILGSALFRLNVGGRIACCGVVSQYDTDRPEPGPKGIPGLLVNKRITMRGFLVFDYADHYARAREEMHGWLSSGQMKALTDEVHGLEAAPGAFVDLLSGGNIGTRVVRLD